MGAFYSRRATTSPSGLTSRLTSRPSDIKKLNESVWEFHRPEGKPEVEVIFFHGLQVSDYREAFWKTWLSRDETVVWPKEWLGPSLREARILSISYDSSARKTDRSGFADMDQIIENLVQDIVLDSTCGIGQNCKVILVGHSLGGIIIKQLLSKCSEKLSKLEPNRSGDEISRLQTFLKNCRGVFYYSSPHGGSELANYARRANRIPGAKLDMPIINFLKVLSDETARINHNFSRFQRTSMLNVTTEGIGELQDTPFAGLLRRVVPEASARHDVDQYYSVPANHFEVCKAETKNSPIFRNLQNFCENLIGTISQSELDSFPTLKGSNLLSS